CYPPESESIRRTYQSICLTSNLQRLNPKEKTSDQTTTERREFNKFLRDASKRIESWPAWKKGLLGKSEFK
ncbi:MAG: hypothetical protein KJ592_03165, partial [Nanoarchaeota archaeon]|nr:hypothetical protein [Nanoarchaeota archaeon]